MPAELSVAADPAGAYYAAMARAREFVATLTARTKGLGARSKELLICPIYASLPSEQQA